MIIEIKYTINVVSLNHPETVSPPQPYPWKNCLLGNLSLALKRLGTAVLDFFVFIEKMKAITGQFLLLSTSEFSSLPVFIPILLLFLTLMIEKKKIPPLGKIQFYTYALDSISCHHLKILLLQLQFFSGIIAFFLCWVTDISTPACCSVHLKLGFDVKCRVSY